jgi:arylamine N-acetyltransferase
MVAHPLLPPEADSPLLPRFLQSQGIDPARPPLELLSAVAQAFARLPFENLTKIIRDAEAGSDSAARRRPAEVLADHKSFGTGGTCFALTSAMLYLVRALGFPAEPILADRRYGDDTHSALLVWLDGQPHLLDPGYLLVKPLPIPKEGEVRIPTPFNELILTAERGGARLMLSTLQQNQRTYRLTFKPTPVDAGEFLHAWDTSFDADMMRYPVLSRVVGDKQYYFQKRHLLIRGREDAQRVEVPPERMIAEIAGQFRIAPAVVARALKHLEKKGEPHG